MTSPIAPRWTRAASLRSLQEPQVFDVLVAGGGIIGAAAALDAAARGLRVALVEMHDYAAETSSRSTKLLHGGIRYLPHFEFGLVREGLLEQKVLVETADFLYQPLEFVLPLYRDRGLADLPAWASNRRLLPAALKVGLTLYDALGSRHDTRHRRVDRAGLLELVPTLRTDGLRGGFVYGDAQTDDARLTITLLKTAVIRHGAVAVNGVKAERVSRRGDELVVHLRDTRGGDEFTARTRAMVAATWATRPPSIVAGDEPADLLLSKGVHLLFDPAPLGIGDRAVVLPETQDERVLFLVPWRGMALFGTTDTPYAGRPEDAVTDAADVEYLLHHLHAYFDIPDVRPHAAFAGVRALVGDGGITAKASRHHQIVELAPGYVQVVGGKLTAHRPIAADAIDRVCGHLGVDAPSSTATELLIGAGLDDDSLGDLAADLGPLGFGEDDAARFLHRYGTEAAHVVDILRARPSTRDRMGGGTFTLAEVAYMARHEAAASLGDILMRRTHAAWATGDHGRADAGAVSRVLAGELEWSDRERAAALADLEQELTSESL